MIQPYKLSELAQHVQAHLVGDGQEIITGVASLESAQRGQITFLTDAKNRHRLAGCQASAVILTEANRIAWSHNALVVTDPYLAYARIAQLLNNTTPQPAPTIAPTAVIAPDVQLEEQVAIGAYAVLEAGVKIGAGAMIGPHCFIGQNVQIGAGSRLWANVTLYHGVSVGQHCLIHAGAVIGSDGFGFANDQGEWVKIPQLGSVCIGDRVEIGANTTIDRGTLDDTMIHDGVIIDNQCQIAHNVVIGAHTAVAGGVIMAGGLKIGRYCRIGGASVINGHMEICDRVAITGMAMVMRSITEPGVYSSGIPAQPNAYWRKTAAQVLHIDQMNKRLKVLERTIKKSYS